MKNKTKTQIMWLILFALTIAVAYMWHNPKVVKINMPMQRPLPLLPRPPFGCQQGNQNSVGHQLSSTNLDTCNKWEL